MRVAMATSVSAPDAVNEDLFLAGPGFAVLLDGAGTRGIEAICRHGVAWYTTRLGGELVARLAFERGPLTQLLGDAIEAVAATHRHTCDLADPSSPSATVAILRLGGGRADYLVLGDSVLLLNGSRALVVDDRREVAFRQPYQVVYDAAAEGSAEWVEARRVYIEALRANRNQPGGFWLAKDDPRAAAEAITGTLPIGEVTDAALLTNGASRYVDRFGLADWAQTLLTLKTLGPEEIIHRVRAAEQAAGVVPDDATVAHLASIAK
ncbi:hypothetical protein [Asanoa iriomotensis]|uniref:Protein phosphatase 2C-like protein n=1 Tax=Asanoa iriomotensis TaxID=234613 RepID=A0ABQ4C708_9ACTN|nr:hypothetical protein [Asanoa iriomotensis]GIF58557.1 hypothetical protein Air01nite_46520 [Asanoa iriomotensis]